MPKIFISYKRQDLDVVVPIVEEIRQYTGVDCWIDMEGIEGGDQFQNVIIDAIDNSDIVIFMLSKNYIAPFTDEDGNVNLHKQTYPQMEVMYALDEGKRLIPFSIDGTRVKDCKWLKFNCASLDCIDSSREEQKMKLYRNICYWCGTKLQKPKQEPKPVVQSENTQVVEDAESEPMTLVGKIKYNRAPIYFAVSIACLVFSFFMNMMLIDGLMLFASFIFLVWSFFNKKKFGLHSWKDIVIYMALPVVFYFIGFVMSASIYSEYDDTTPAVEQK